jgi:hypothetical protein
MASALESELKESEPLSRRRWCRSAPPRSAGGSGGRPAGAAAAASAAAMSALVEALRWRAVRGGAAGSGVRPAAAAGGGGGAAAGQLRAASAPVDALLCMPPLGRDAARPWLPPPQSARGPAGIGGAGGAGRGCLAAAHGSDAGKEDAS